MTTTAATVALLDAATFDEEIATSAVPVLVEFWAEWCPPCKLLAPILDELATDFGDELRVRKVNVDEQPNLAARFDLMAVPTILLFVDDEIRMRLVGALSKPGWSRRSPRPPPSAGDDQTPAVLVGRVRTDIEQTPEPGLGLIEFVAPCLDGRQFAPGQLEHGQVTVLWPGAGSYRRAGLSQELGHLGQGNAE